MKGILKGAVLAFGIALSASAAQAQSSPLTFGVGGGLTIPMNDGLNTGFNILGSVGFQPPALPFGIRIDGQFNRNGVDTDLDVQTRAISVTGNAVYRFAVAPTTKIRPYLIGGIGAYNLKATGSDVPDGVDGETKMGLNAGAGLNFAAGAASLFVEGRFHTVFTEGENYKIFPITVGIRFGGK